MGRPGRKRRLGLEDEYWKLIDAGVGTVEACRRLGIGRTTGYYWRAQRGGLRRSVLPEDTRSSRYLSLLERERIAVLCAEGVGVREIARRLRRAPSTISRELRRNLRAGDRGRYDAGLAHARAREQARRRREPIFTRDLELKSLVQERLELQWSPEQIAAWLRSTFPQQPKWHVCHETIYQGLYYGGQHGLSRQLTKNLRTGRALRRRRRSARRSGAEVHRRLGRDRPAPSGRDRPQPDRGLRRRSDRGQRRDQRGRHAGRPRQRLPTARPPPGRSHRQAVRRGAYRGCVRYPRATTADVDMGPRR
jgi:IS30 family transposase